MVSRLPRASHSISSSTIVAMAGNRNSQPPSILAPKNKRISGVLGYARDHIAEEPTLERLAEAVGMSRRQFSRTFRAQTGTTPARVVERLRADVARGRLETTAQPVEKDSGGGRFGDAENMRRAFIRVYGQPPQSIRRAIRS
jgi:transcriptional regulator GlxA family with amidase domain